MQMPVTSGAVLYAKDLGRVSEFYAAVAAMAVTESASGHVTMESNGFQLVVVAVPRHIAATIHVQSPPIRREATPIKLIFFVQSIEAAAAKVAQLGGQMNPAEQSWQFQGAAVLDGHDPEGNVFQLRQGACTECDIDSLHHMQPDERRVTHIPLAELWNESGPLVAVRGRYLNSEELRQLLQAGGVTFVVANLDHSLHWVTQPETFGFWKTEVRQHLVNEPDRPFNVYDYAQGYCYIASEWKVAGQECPVVVLETHH